jgi:hypothetical protein
VRPVALLAVLLAGCDTPRDPGVADTTQAAEAAPDPADSLALAVGEAEVWYTLARPGRGADGTMCVDRALEIRRGGTRIPVPLLYTGTAPEAVNDSTIRARLSDRCEPGASYFVSLKTGRPTPER